MTPATTLTKITFPQINCNVKETLWRLQEKDVRCNRKPTFHYKRKLHEVFRAGLNEIKYDYVYSKQHFYLQYHVAATDMKALGRKQTTFQAVEYLGFTAPGDKSSHPARSWQHKIKETLQSDALLAIISFQGQSYLAFAAENVSIILSKSWKDLNVWHILTEKISNASGSL